ncbi:MAG: 4-hydroxy-tetrahydrodipicolinate synthase [bacterium]|nr:4-hydroxy-tetrahydrodipicolinate synthase [bacterium]
MDFGRVITAMVTPFDEQGEVNYEMAILIADYLVENGTDTLLLSGTTGESPTLSHDEEFNLYAKIVGRFKGKVPIMAGTGSNCTATAIDSTQEAEKIGVDASLQVVPYYNKPSQAGLIAHFNAIANNTNLPILLYNIPGRTGVNMEPETVAVLAEHPQIVGIKEAAGSVPQVERIRALTPPEFRIYSGDDSLTLPFMEKGAHGVVSVASHVAGLDIKRMIELFLEGNSEAASALHQKMAPLFEALFITSNPVPVKAALRLLGFSMGGPRLPLVGLTPEQHAAVESVLDAYLESTQV